MNIRCLIIDRNPIFSGKLQNAIEGFGDGFRVQTAGDVDEAIAAIVSTDFSLVLCEPSLADPQKGLISRIMDQKPAMPLIVTGQDGSPASKELADHSCVKGFISRPVVQTAELAGRVVIALGSLFSQGNVRGVNCVTLFQILEQECSDCTLRVLNTRENEEGLLFLKKGVLFDAVCGAAVAQEAAKTVFSWENVDVELYNFCPLKDNKVAADMTSLILKCANKQHASEQPSPVVEKDNPPVSGAKPVGGLAGLLLKKANKRPPS